MWFGYFYLPLSISGEANLKLKRAFLFQLFVIFFVTIFCSLGTWQIYRLQWKTDLISEINFGLKSQPIEYSNSIEKNYQRVIVKGKYNFDKQIYLYSLNDSGKPGYDVITPFKTNKKENVLINRGWIPKELKGDSTVNFNLNSDQQIVGLLRKIYKANMFKPANDIVNNIWFSIKIDDLETITGEQFKEFIIFLEDNKAEIPMPKKISIDVPNNHLKYAITWYAISISIIFYYLYFRRKG
mgnify:CR=1 FL=1